MICDLIQNKILQRENQDSVNHMKEKKITGKAWQAT